MTVFIITFALVYGLYCNILMGMFLRYKDEIERKNFDKAHKWGKAWHGWRVVMSLGMAILVVPVSFPDVLFMLLLVLWSLFITYCLFNIMINLFRGLNIWYCGSPASGTDSWWDKVTYKYHKLLMITDMSITAAYSVFYLIFIHL